MRSIAVLLQVFSELLDVNDCLTGKIALEVLEKQIGKKEMKTAMADAVEGKFARLMTREELIY